MKLRSFYVFAILNFKTRVENVYDWGLGFEDQLCNSFLIIRGGLKADLGVTADKAAYNNKRRIITRSRSNVPPQPNFSSLNCITLNNLKLNKFK